MAIIWNAIARLTADTSAFDRNMNRSRQSLRAVQQQSLSLQKTLIKLTAVYYGARGLTRAVGSFTSAAFEGERAQNRLYSLMRNVTGTTAEQAAEVVNLTEAMQQYTTVGDDIGQVGASQLATFQLQTESLKKLLPSLYDMAVATKGVHVEQKEMIDVANVMGKAMLGQTGMLSRYGITMTDAQRKILQTGNETERTAMLVDVLSQNFGGLAEAAAQTTEGIREQTALAWSDVKEGMGEVLLPAYKTTFETIRDYLTTNQRDMEAWAKYTVATMGAVSKAWHSIRIPMRDAVIEPMAEVEINRAALERYLLEVPDDIRAQQDLEMAKMKPWEIKVGLNKFWQKKPELQYPALLEGKRRQLERDQSGVVKQEQEIIKLRLQRPPMTGGYALPEFGVGGMAPGESAAGGSDMVAETKASASQIEAAMRRMYSDIDAKSKDSYQLRWQLLNVQHRKFLDIIDDKATVQKWLHEQTIKLAEEEAIATGSFFDGMKAKIQEINREIVTMGGLGAQAGESIQSGIGTAINEAAWGAGKFNDIMKDVLRSTAKAFTQGLINQAVSSASGSLFASIFHDGGTVGQGGPQRRVPASVFVGAPRFHDGGEVPALLTRGERVQTAAQVAAGDQGLAAVSGRLDRLIDAVERNRQITLIDARDPDEMMNQWAASQAGERAINHAVEVNN